MENGHLLRKLLAPHWWDLSPEETKIFVTLFWYADPATGELSLSQFRLSQKINMKATSIAPFLNKLEQRGLIGFTAGNNPFLDTHIKLLFSSKINDQESGEKNIAEPSYLPLDDNVSGNDKRSFKKNDKIDNETGIENSAQKLTAEFIAEQFSDLENLALYKAYMKRYSYDIIKKAFQEVIQISQEKIKKSKGAYFTFLVKKYGSNL